MKNLIRSVAGRLRQWSPTTLTLLVIIYELALGWLDFMTPVEMSFSIFYLLGVALAGWRAGTRAAVIVSTLTAGIMASHELSLPRDNPARAFGLCAWNTSTRFLLFCAAGWLTAEITRLNRQLQSLVAARTIQLRAEIEKHKATSLQLGETLARLHAIIAGAPIILFAVDRKGIITLEDGRALRLLGVEPGTHVGQSALTVFESSRELTDQIQRALSGEEFNASVQIGSVTLETWYSPTRANDGSLSGYTGVALNVSDQRRLERQILEISDREQARIGQEIHDGLCQQLVGLAFDANSLENELAAANLPQARTAKRMADFLDRAITEARQLARGLFPIRLDAQGLPSALEELARSTRERFGIQCCFESSPRVVVETKTAATHLYRIAQEAVNNAFKHGHATIITLRLLARERQLELEVEDDGVGMSSGKLKECRGMGLHIMDYRARSIGGRFAFGPGNHGGTLVSCCVPGPVN